MKGGCTKIIGGNVILVHGNVEKPGSLRTFPQTLSLFSKKTPGKTPYKSKEQVYDE